MRTQSFNKSCETQLKLLQGNVRYSWLSLSRPRLSRITTYLEVKILSLLKHENLTTGKNIVEKRRNFSFPQYFQYISNFKSPITYIFVKCVCWIIFSSILQIWYVEVRISRSISESPLEFKIRPESTVYNTHIHTYNWWIDI